MVKNLLVAGCVLVAFVSNSSADTSMEGSPVQSLQQERLTSQTGVDSSSQTLTRTMERNNFHRQNILRIQDQLQIAAQQGLPVEPIVQKVHEGLAKKINEEQIADAVERLRTRYALAYQQAATITRSNQYAHRIGTTIANSYTAGLTPAECDRIMERLQTRTRTMSREQADNLALHTMETAQLMARRGVAPETIGSVLSHALEHSYQSRDMQTLQSSFMKMSRDRPAEMIARQYSAEISTGMGPESLGNGGSMNDSRGPGSSQASGSATGQAGKAGSQDSGNSGNKNSSGGSSSEGSSRNSDGNGGSGGNAESNSGQGGQNGSGNSSSSGKGPGR